MYTSVNGRKALIWLLIHWKMGTMASFGKYIPQLVVRIVTTGTSTSLTGHCVEVFIPSHHLIETWNLLGLRCRPKLTEVVMPDWMNRTAHLIDKLSLQLTIIATLEMHHSTGYILAFKILIF